MNQGYVVKIGKAYIKTVYTNECVLTKTFNHACVFTKKKDVVEMSNRFGGNAMVINLCRLEESE